MVTNIGLKTETWLQFGQLQTTAIDAVMELHSWKLILILKPLSRCFMQIRTPQLFLIKLWSHTSCEHDQFHSEQSYIINIDNIINISTRVTLIERTAVSFWEHRILCPRDLKNIDYKYLSFHIELSWKYLTLTNISFVKVVFTLT